MMAGALLPVRPVARGTVPVIYTNATEESAGG